MGRLARFELFNFKSYKGLHTVSLGDASFTSIIGPNGSGKSNMMDAVSFVLGVRSRQLRTTHHRDLIFRDRILDRSREDSAEADSAYVMAVYVKDDGTELHLKRTVRLSGASDYRINNRVVSQDNYNEVLAAENIIVKANNFLVFQGDVEAVASQSPKDLRDLIENISGSVALKADYDRLALAKDDVTALSSTLFQRRKEQTAEVRLIEKQAQEVDEYNRKRQYRDDLQLQRLLARMYGAERKAGQFRDQTNSTESQLKAARLDRDLAKRAVERLQQAQAQAALELKRAETQAQQQAAAASALQDQQLLPLDARLSAAEQSLRGQRKRVKELEQVRDQQQREVAKLEKDLATVRAALVKFEREHGAGSDASISDADALQYETLKSRFNQNTAVTQIQLAGLQRRVNQCRVEAEAAKAVRDKDQTDLANAVAELGRLKSRASQIKASVRDDKGNLKQAKIQQAQASQKLQDGMRDLDRLNQNLVTCVRQIQESESARRAPAKDRQMRETTAMLKRIVPGVFGMVFDLCEPSERRYDTAVATTLGRHFNAIVVDTFSTARECITVLKEQRIGSMTFIALDTVKTRPVNGSLRSLGDGDIRLAIDTVRFDAAVERAIHYVCGDTVICPDLDTARRLKWQQHLDVKIVTLDGSVIHKRDLMSGGRAENSNARKWDEAKAEQLAAQKDKLTERIAVLNQSLRQLRVEAEDLASTCAKLEVVVAQGTRELEQIQVAVEGCESTRRHLQAKLQSESGVRYDECQRALAESEASYSELEATESTQRRAMFQEFCERLGIADITEFERIRGDQAQRLEQARLQHSRQVARLESQLRFEKSRLDMTAQRLVRATDSCRQSQHLIDDLQAQREQVAGQIEAARAQAEASAQSFTQLRTAAESKRKDLNEAQARARSHQEMVESVGKSLDQVRNLALKAANEQLAVLRSCKLDGMEVPLSKGSLDDIPLEEVFIETLDHGMYGIEVDYRKLPVKWRSKDDESMDADQIDAAIAAELQALDRFLEQSTLDFRAATRLAEAREKLDTIASQLSEANELSRSISAEFKQVQQQRVAAFRTAYEHVSANIDRVYKQLTRRNSALTGGSAYLTLSNSDEPYLEGITYNVVPPNKRFVEMDSLSGGERTMAALALLFAVHSFRPAPFFILDEIDAALDNANVNSIAQYIAANSGPGLQIIIISLKPGLFQNSEALVGIYRDQALNSSRPLTYDLRVA